MDWTATHQHLSYDEIEICDNCGCKFRVKAYEQAGHNETEEYYCPNCKKKYKTRACNAPDVYKISDDLENQKHN